MFNDEQKHESAKLFFVFIVHSNFFQNHWNNFPHPFFAGFRPFCLRYIICKFPLAAGSKTVKTGF